MKKKEKKAIYDIYEDELCRIYEGPDGKTPEYVLKIDDKTEELFENRFYYPRIKGHGDLIKHITKRNRETGEITLIVKFYHNRDDPTPFSYFPPKTFENATEYLKLVKEIEESDSFRETFDIENVDIRWDHIDWEKIKRKSK